MIKKFINIKKKWKCGNIKDKKTYPLSKINILLYFSRYFCFKSLID